MRARQKCYLNHFCKSHMKNPCHVQVSCKSLNVVSIEKFLEPKLLWPTHMFKKKSFLTKNTVILFHFKNLKIVCIDFVLPKILIQKNCNKQQFTIIMDRAKVFQNDLSPQQMKTFNHLSHESPSPIN
jgi:hypothetical protein